MTNRARTVPLSSGLGTHPRNEGTAGGPALRPRVPDGVKSKGVETIGWIFGKKIIQGKYKHQPGNVESTFLETYDSQAEVFRSWYFDSNGNHPRGETTGQWDEESKTMTYKSTDPKQVTGIMTLRFVSPDRIDWHRVWREKDGRIVMEIDGRLIRRDGNKK